MFEIGVKRKQFVKLILAKQEKKFMNNIRILNILEIHIICFILLRDNGFIRSSAISGFIFSLSENAFDNQIK